MKNTGNISKIICIIIMIILMAGVLSTVSAETDTGQPTAVTEQAVQTSVKVDPPKLKVGSAKSRQVTLKWNKIKGATHYQIYHKKGKNKWKKLKTFSASKTKYTKKKLSMKMTYSYKIRAKVNGVWTSFSPKVKKIKVKGKYKQPSMYGSNLSGKELRKVRDRVANFVNKNQTWRLSQAEKAELAAQYVSRSIKYNDRNRTKYYNTAYGGLIRKKGVCSAFMRSYKALADGMGLKCKCIHTNVNFSAHQWCHVKVEGTWYVLETQSGTWMGKVSKPDRNSDDLFENYYVMKR